MQRLIFLVGVALLVAGCALGPQGPVGRWQEDSRAGEPFRKRILLSDHTYYWCGDPVMPEAIIAIDNRYTLRTRVWSHRPMTQKVLDDWMFWIDKDLDFHCSYRSGIILSPDGRQVGIWYAKKRISVVTEPEPGVLQVYPPWNPAGSICERREWFGDR